MSNGLPNAEAESELETEIVRFRDAKVYELLTLTPKCAHLFISTNSEILAVVAVGLRSRIFSSLFTSESR